MPNSLILLLTICMILGSVSCTGGKASKSSKSNEQENSIAFIGGNSGAQGGASDQSTGGISSEEGGVVSSEEKEDITDGSSSGVVDSGVTGTEAGSISEGHAELLAALEGEWSKACILIDTSDKDIGYRIWTLSFAGNRFSSYIRNFTTPGCTSASAIYSQVIFQGHYELGETSLSSDGLTVQQIDVHTQTPIKSVEFDIFYLDGTDLYFGDTSGTSDGTSLEKRPKSIDFYWGLSRDQ